MDIRKLSLRSLVFAAAAALPIAAASAAMACTTPGGSGGPVLTSYQRPYSPPVTCKPYSAKNRFYPGQNKPGGWCVTYCTPREYGRWVHKGQGWEWVVTVYKGKYPGPVCKPGGKTPPPPSPRKILPRPNPWPTCQTQQPDPRLTCTKTPPSWTKTPTFLYPTPTWTHQLKR